MRVLALSALLLLLFPLAGMAATLTVDAGEMRVTREGGLVKLVFPSGMSAVSSSGYKVHAGSATILLRSAGFEQGKLAPPEKGKEPPKLPATKLSADNIKEMTFSGGVTWESKEYRAKAGSVSSTDGGKTWKLGGGVEFREAAGKQSAKGKSFTFARDAKTLTTSEPIELFGFAVGGESASFASKRTVINLGTRQATLTGAARFTFADYSLQSDLMKLDLAKQTLTATGSPHFTQGDSRLDASQVVITFSEGKAIMKAQDLKGRLVPTSPTR
jgi:lipopolysaccharide export system protein LptA